MFASMLMLVVCFTANNSFAQAKAAPAKMKDCCMMKDGKMDKCDMMMKDAKSSTDKKADKMEMAKTYTCTMHPEVMSDKPGKCSKCGMGLVEKQKK